MKCLVYVCAALAASLATTAQAGGAVELSEDNFGKKVAGKNAFVKFLAPVSTGSIENQFDGLLFHSACTHLFIISLFLSFLSLSFLSLSLSHSGVMDSGEGTANP